MKAESRHGVAILADIVVAPRAAFDALAVRMHWGWAFAVTALLGTAGSGLLVPALLNVTRATLAQRLGADSAYAASSPQAQQQAQDAALALQHYVWLAYPLGAIGAIVIATIVTVLCSITARGDAGFAKHFSLNANVAVITLGIGPCVAGVVAALRGPAALVSQTDIALLLPSLAWFVPNAGLKIVMLSSVVNPFNVWAGIVLARGLVAVARMRRAAAYVAAALVAFGGAAFSVPFAQ